MSIGFYGFINDLHCIQRIQFGLAQSVTQHGGLVKIFDKPGGASWLMLADLLRSGWLSSPCSSLQSLVPFGTVFTIESRATEHVPLASRFLEVVG